MIACSAWPILGSILCELHSCLNAIRVNALAFNVEHEVFVLQGGFAGAGLGWLSKGCQAGLWQAFWGPASVAATLMTFLSESTLAWC